MDTLLTRPYRLLTVARNVPLPSVLDAVTVADSVSRPGVTVPREAGTSFHVTVRPLKADARNASTVAACPAWRVSEEVDSSIPVHDETARTLTCALADTLDCVASAAVIVALPVPTARTCP